MSESLLPERPDLGQLRRRAKELRDAARRGDPAALARLARHHPAPPQSAVSLAAAQLVIARELGFANWPTLKAAVEADAASGQAVNVFVAASVDGRLGQASAILRADPAIAGRSLLAAAVLGDVGAARTMLAADPAAAVAVDDERGWPPLLYACYSRWHEIDSGRAAGLAEVVRVLLEAGASPDTNDGGRPRFRSALKGSVKVDNPEVAAALLDTGADPGAGEDGVSALRLAVRAGRTDAAARLRAAGAADDVTDIDRFIGACISGDRPAAEDVLAGHPDLPDRLTGQDRAVIVGAAGSCPVGTMAVMLDLGFSPHARNELGEQSLHTAAYYGNAAVVRLLLDAGADVDARDARFDSTPLAFATVGSGEQAGQPGDWAGTVRLLIEAGASRQGAWITGKPPSEEIMDLVRRYGITPDESAETEDEDEAEVPGPIGAGVMADIARRLETAFRDKDLSLLGTLLHPQVRWTGLCTSSDQVLGWYRALAAAGTEADVRSVEVDRDAVVLGLAVGGRAEGARPAPRQQLYQVFTVADSQIIGIRGYPDRHSALARSPGSPRSR